MDSGFFYFFTESAVGGAPLEIFQRFKAYNSYAIEMKLGRIIERHQSAQSLGVGFSGFLQRTLLGRAFPNFRIGSQATVFIRLIWNSI